MSKSLIQFRDRNGARRVALLDDRGARLVTGAETTLQLAHQAIAEDATLAELAMGRLGVGIALEEVTLLAPVDHPDPARLLLSGTGLTHIGSAAGRDAMHRKTLAGTATTDSMRMFQMGVEGGRPEPGAAGAQPEWFYKGNGHSLVASGEALLSPDFALDAGEEPEIAGIYLIDPEGRPRRLGFALANEFSDHVTERGNYLWLAHSKLRPAALGPELLLGDLPATVRGMTRIWRGEQLLWERAFLSGEAGMSHSLANLEHHHFKYRQFRVPGDVHVHFFGTATLSFGEVDMRPGDIVEIGAEPFRLALRNPIGREPPSGLIAARAM